jgi:hypothetical protein
MTHHAAWYWHKHLMQKLKPDYSSSALLHPHLLISSNYTFKLKIQHSGDNHSEFQYENQNTHSKPSTLGFTQSGRSLVLFQNCSHYNPHAFTGHGLTLTTHEHLTHWATSLQWSRQPCKAMPHHTWRLTFLYSTTTISELEAPETSLTMISPCPPPTWSSVLCFCSLMKQLAPFQGKESIAESHISHNVRNMNPKSESIEVYWPCVQI